MGSFPKIKIVSGYRKNWHPDAIQWQDLPGDGDLGDKFPVEKKQKRLGMGN